MAKKAKAKPAAKKAAPKDDATPGADSALLNAGATPGSDSNLEASTVGGGKSSMAETAALAGATDKGGDINIKTAGRATFLKLKDSVTKVKQQNAAINMIKQLQGKAKVEEADAYDCISAANDYVDMSKVNILTAMHPHRRANKKILKKHNPKLKFADDSEEIGAQQAFHSRQPDGKAGHLRSASEAPKGK